MKNIKKLMYKSLYVIFPILSFIVVYLLFAFIKWEINLVKMGVLTRYWIIVFGLILAFLSIMLSNNINYDQ